MDLPCPGREGEVYLATAKHLDFYYGSLSKGEESLVFTATL